MNQIGLVFEGGGGKGAYQIGVWKYLREKGLDRFVGGVSGTSVGALNAVLFAAGDYSTAERIWKNISRDQILSSKAFTDTLAGAGSQAALANIWRTVSRSAIERTVNQAMGQALFTRDGLLRIMHRYVDMRKVQRAGIPCFATCLEISGVLPAVKRFELRCYAKNNIETILLASSAIPIVFDPILFDGKLYCDGGVELLGGDNTPIRPLYDRGIRFFIVVHLSRDSKVDCIKFPGACILEITPQIDLGNLFTGTLDFSSESAMRRIEQGYKDTKRVFEEYFGAKKASRI